MTSLMKYDAMLAHPTAALIGAALVIAVAIVTSPRKAEVIRDLGWALGIRPRRRGR